MKLLGVKERDIDFAHSVLAGILHIGNITFVVGKEAGAQVKIENKDGATISFLLSLSPTALEKASLCLGITNAALIKALSFRSISVDASKTLLTPKR